MRAKHSCTTLGTLQILNFANCYCSATKGPEGECLDHKGFSNLTLCVHKNILSKLRVKHHPKVSTRQLALKTMPGQWHL